MTGSTVKWQKKPVFFFVWLNRSDAAKIHTASTRVLKWEDLFLFKIKNPSSALLLNAENVNFWSSFICSFFLSVAIFALQKKQSPLFSGYFSFLQCATFTAVKKKVQILLKHVKQWESDPPTCSLSSRCWHRVPRPPVASSPGPAPGLHLHLTSVSAEGLAGYQAPSIKGVPSGARSGLAAPPGEQQHNQTEEPHGPQPLQQGRAVFGDDHLGQVVGDEGNLVSHTDKDEGADHDVEWRVPWNQDQDPLGVCRQPDVILAYEQLGETNNAWWIVGDLICAHFLLWNCFLPGSYTTSHTELVRTEFFLKYCHVHLTSKEIFPNHAKKELYIDRA